MASLPPGCRYRQCGNHHCFASNHLAEQKTVHPIRSNPFAQLLWDEQARQGCCCLAAIAFSLPWPVLLFLMPASLFHRYQCKSSDQVNAVTLSSKMLDNARCFQAACMHNVLCMERMFSVHQHRQSEKSISLLPDAPLLFNLARFSTCPCANAPRFNRVSQLIPVPRVRMVQTTTLVCLSRVFIN